MNKSTALLLFVFIQFSSLVKAQRCGDFYNNKKQNFKLKNKFTLEDSAKIKTTGVYLYTYIPESDSSKKIFKFYKFYEDGKVFISGEYCGFFPSQSDLKDTTYGGKSYYQIKGSKINIEAYDRGYLMENGVIADNSKLVFYSFKPRWFLSSLTTFPKPKEYIFIPFER
jgi:hypothetical protein